MQLALWWEVPGLWETRGGADSGHPEDESVPGAHQRLPRWGLNGHQGQPGVRGGVALQTEGHLEVSG